MRFLISLAVLSGALGLMPLQAEARCACLCVDGTFKTVCTAPEEVRSSLAICEARSHVACPSNPEAVVAETYEAPAEGIGNCRDAQIYDAEAGEYMTTKLCDVVSGSSAD